MHSYNLQLRMREKIIEPNIKYSKIGQNRSKKFIDLVVNEGYKVRWASKMLKINQSTAKYILKLYKTTGTLSKKAKPPKKAPVFQIQPAHQKKPPQIYNYGSISNEGYEEGKQIQQFFDYLTMFNLDYKCMRPLYRTWQINKFPCFGLTIFARQTFEICNLSGKPYLTLCLFPPQHLSNSGLLPSRLLADILIKDYTKLPSQSIEVELQNMQTRIKKMQSIDVNSQQLHYHLGICLLLREKYEEAIQQIRKAWLLNKSDPNYCIQIAVCLMESGNYFEAIKLLERQLRDNPTNSNLHHHLAIAYFNVENYREAIFNFYKNYQINQELQIDLISRGEELFKGKKYIEALPFYLKRLIHQQRDEKVINTLKDCFIQENQLDKAMQVYQSLGEVQQYKDVVEHSVALLYFQTGDIQKSLTHLEAAISQNPESYQLNLYLATAYFKEGRLQDATNHYLRCLNSRSSDYTVLSSLAMVYMKLNQTEKAQQFYQKSLKLNQSYSMSWYGYGLIHFQRNNIEEGIKCLEKAIQTDESNYPALEKLGSAYILLGEEQKGKKMFLKAEEVKKEISEN